MQPTKITLFHNPVQVEQAMRHTATRSFYKLLENLRSAARDFPQKWVSYPTFRDYAQICFWAMRKLEYSFIIENFTAIESAGNSPLRVLDVGCGVVPLNNWISARGHEVIAVDPLFEDIEFLVKNNLNKFYNSNVFYITALGEGLPFPTGYFDVVISASVLEYTIPGNDRVILDEIARVLKPNGNLLITFDISPQRSLQEGESPLSHELRTYGYPFQPDAVRRMVRWMSRYYMITGEEVPNGLDELTWEDVHAFWRAMQEHDGRETSEREYLAIGLVLARNDRAFQMGFGETLRAYREGQSALEQQLYFYRYHAEHRMEVIRSLNQNVSEKERVIRSLNQNLSEKEKVIQNLNKTMIWKNNHLLTISLNIRDRFTPKLGIYHQYPPRPLLLPKSYRTITNGHESTLPMISIVTPSYNQADFLERTIKSVLSQEYPQLEYILQDGGSSDGSTEIIDRYRNRLSHVESIRDSGQANAINRGFRHVTGEIMAYLNSDDMLLPGTLHYVAEYFSRHPKVNVVYGHRIIVDKDDHEVGIWVLPPHDRKVIEWADYVPQETL
ncbi:MAG: glycosyltransferase, partial [Chloroflexi bacterium]|nr:glycosyltransferase [Chloroflexota bacterium]